MDECCLSRARNLGQLDEATFYVVLSQLKCELMDGFTRYSIVQTTVDDDGNIKATPLNLYLVESASVQIKTQKSAFLSISHANISHNRSLKSPKNKRFKTMSGRSSNSSPNEGRMLPNYLLLILPLCVDKDSCCDNTELHKLEGLFANYTNSNAECATNCFLETAPRLKLNNDFHLYLHQCLYDCIGRKLKIINNRNKFVQKKYIALLENVNLNEEARVVVESCSNDYRDFSPKNEEYNDVGLRLEHCLFKILQLGCMPENQNDVTECKRLQQYLEEGVNQKICPTFTYLDHLVDDVRIGVGK
ncbi:hypothetical protein Trydic_g21343 [Trypoxylus dichotomus]